MSKTHDPVVAILDRLIREVPMGAGHLVAVTTARHALAEFVEAAQDVPVEYDFHGAPLTPEWARFVAALELVGGGA